MVWNGLNVGGLLDRFRKIYFLIIFIVIGVSLKFLVEKLLFIRWVCVSWLVSL